MRKICRAGLAVGSFVLAVLVQGGEPSARGGFQAALQAEWKSGENLQMRKMRSRTLSEFSTKELAHWPLHA